jgi:SAM-dependent methyltransferase
MIELARKRTGGRAKLHVADMSNPLPFVESGGFDVVVSSLAIDYVYDWSTPLKEFWRALRLGGRFIFTVQHPLGAYLWYNPPSAFGVQYVQATWRGFGGEPVVVPDYYRSFEEIINPLLQAGYTIKQIFDTKPLAALQDKDPQAFEKYSRIPTFMCVEVEKR